jgi:hypothetical protein
MSTATIDHESSDRLLRIQSNPNPRSLRGRLRLVLNFFRTLDRDRAFESGKIIFAIIGVATVLADLSTMRAWFLLPALSLVFLTWFAIYRHTEN